MKADRAQDETEAIDKYIQTSVRQYALPLKANFILG